MIAAADHNTTAGVRALQAAGARHGVRVIAGVEIDSGFGGKLWHTLVYGVDPEEPALLALCAAVFERNMADAAALRIELARRGFAIEGWMRWAARRTWPMWARRWRAAIRWPGGWPARTTRAPACATS